MAVPKQTAAAVAAARGPRRSTHGPPKAALSPSSTSAEVKVVYGGLNHQGDPGNSSWMGRLKVLHAYTEPMHRCTATAPSGMNQRLEVMARHITAAGPDP